MTKEYIPSPTQLMSLLDSDIEIRCVLSNSHGLYLLYNDIDSQYYLENEFTLELSGIPNLSSSKNYTNSLCQIMIEWQQPLTKQLFNAWVDGYNRRALQSNRQLLKKV